MNYILKDRYRLEQLLGEGRFAQVFLAYDQFLKRQAAIKVMKAHPTDNPLFLKLFQLEIRFLTSHNHPNILAVYDYGQADNKAFLVMTYVIGGTLYEKLKTGKRLNLGQIGHYLGQAAEALDYAHPLGFVHRDIKPSNIVLATSVIQARITEVAKIIFNHGDTYYYIVVNLLILKLSSLL